MNERIKEHSRDIKLSRNQTSVSEHANKTGHYPFWEEVNLIDRDPQKHCICITYGLKTRGWDFINRNTSH